MSEIGSNSNGQLKSIVERIERLEEEKKVIADDIKDVYAESKSSGFDVPALKAIIARRRKDQEKLAAHELIVETYDAALGD
jgi:uncharacterized protein (UPF0335 family)